MSVRLSGEGPTKRNKLNTNLKVTDKVVIIRSDEFYQKLYFLCKYSLITKFGQYGRKEITATFTLTSKIMTTSLV